MATNPVTWFELNVLDMERAKAFYSTVFQVEFQDMSNPEMAYWCFPMDDGEVGAGGALMKMAGCEPGKGGTMVYFSCVDCAVEEGRVAPAGGTVCRPKMPIGEFGFISVVIDTEGNPIGLHSLK
ncbi:VOC family protein [Synechococcus sp. BSF8S]|uniref:VOC family protein n=1 Tax=Synechococcales TaxID=1890424 RepID=UPI001626935F|nr:MULTISPECIES: VOC family protein [unclassified Synechococcus]MBC1260466.1 VOC family protein [Synechococcus sp. BSF8S]MBC1263837.1 VOC family protein [Synechococcus sp. BSA11S]